MSAPVNRMSDYYADVALASTIDYIGYCFKRIYPTVGPIWGHENRPIEGEFRCHLVRRRNNHGFVVRFRVPVDAGEAKIKAICIEAADTLDNMILRIKTK